MTGGIAALFGTLWILWLLIILSVIFLSIASFVFNIFMLIDCINRDFKDKQTWLIVLIVGFFVCTGTISSILYYFMVKKKNL